MCYFSNFTYLCLLVVVVAISLVPFYGFEKAVPLVQAGETLVFFSHYHCGVHFDLLNWAVTKQYCACSNPRAVDEMKEKIG